MSLTAVQIRQACALLRWKAPRLSQHARISYRAALNARQDEWISAVSDTDLWAVRQAFEAAGVCFTAENGGPDVRLRKTDPA